MEFAEWAPVYEAILKDFGYDRGADERGRDLLVELADPFDTDRLAGLAGATVAIVGAGPSLPAELDRVRACEVDAVIAASAATEVLRSAGIGIDLATTDLDKTPGTALALTRDGVPVAVHAHGDNIPVLREWVPQFVGEQVLPTTQAEPSGPVRNFGGFTDGDRAAFIADHLGAQRLVFAGWDFDDPTVGPAKRRKLRWAARLLSWLERRRGDRFGVLDGRRADLEPADRVGPG